MKKIITISREFGSGGRTIGREVAKRLGYSFYDKELIEKIAEESGLSEEYIEEHGESSPGKSYFGYALSAGIYPAVPLGIIFGKRRGTLLRGWQKKESV